MSRGTGQQGVTKAVQVAQRVEEALPGGLQQFRGPTYFLCPRFPGFIALEGQLRNVSGQGTCAVVVAGPQGSDGETRCHLGGSDKVTSRLQCSHLLALHHSGVPVEAVGVEVGGDVPVETSCLSRVRRQKSVGPAENGGEHLRVQRPNENLLCLFLPVDTRRTHGRSGVRCSGGMVVIHRRRVGLVLVAVDNIAIGSDLVLVSCDAQPHVGTREDPTVPGHRCPTSLPAAPAAVLTPRERPLAVHR